MAEWEFPDLGFDPLPGDPELVADLVGESRLFASRLVEMSESW